MKVITEDNMKNVIRELNKQGYIEEVSIGKLNSVIGKTVNTFNSGTIALFIKSMHNAEYLTPSTNGFKLLIRTKTKEVKKDDRRDQAEGTEGHVEGGHREVRQLREGSEKSREGGSGVSKEEGGGGRGIRVVP